MFADDMQMQPVTPDVDQIARRRVAVVVPAAGQSLVAPADTRQ